MKKILMLNFMIAKDRPFIYATFTYHRKPKKHMLHGHRKCFKLGQKSIQYTCFKPGCQNVNLTGSLKTQIYGQRLFDV
jgi:hypothetical protein